MNVFENTKHYIAGVYHSKDIKIDFVTLNFMNIIKKRITLFKPK